jgi:Zn-dependent protease with chaperone function
MTAIGRAAVVAAVSVLATAAAPAAHAGSDAQGEIKGMGEFLKPGILIVNGQRVRLAPETKTKGVARAEAVPLGSEVKASGAWRSDGSLLATRIEVKPNTRDNSELQLLAACNDIEALYSEAGQALRHGRDGSVIRLGAITDRGPQHKRSRAILDRLLPPYLDPGDVRLYVVDNKEWNAFAMANFAIYVHSGLLADLDDDEVAIVLGHELAHATLEHSRRTMKRGRWARIARGAASIGGEVMGGWGGLAVDSLGGLGASALSNGFSRGFEDEADRVGLRYAYEGGYRADKAPALWVRFAEKYKDGSGVGNFLFGSHASSRERAKDMEAEVAKNYAAGIDDPPSRTPVASTRR